MGRIRTGANGGFSGKAGSVIGSSWNSIHYIKGLPKLSNKPASQLQLEHRAKFAAVTSFLGPIREVLKIGWKGEAVGRSTAVNMAVQHTFNHCLIGDYPNYTVDPGLLLVSKGTLEKPHGVTLASVNPATITLGWSYTPDSFLSHSDDKILHWCTTRYNLYSLRIAIRQPVQYQKR